MIEETPETPVETPETPVETPETPVETPETPVEIPFESPSEFMNTACVSEFEPGVMTSAIREMIGTPACGFEYLEYGVAGAMFIILIAIVVSVFIGFSKMYGAR